jgi:PleD family two-component response regulator
MKDDCCPALPAYCSSYNIDVVCDPADLVNYNPTICAACRCNADSWECTDDQCVLVDTCDDVTDFCPAPFVTGSGREDDRTRALEIGIDYYLVKPADPRFLESLLRQRLR